MYLSSFESSNGLIKEGPALVTLASVLDCTSFDDIEYKKPEGLVITGLDAKKNEFKWTNSTRQVAILVIAESGAVVHRFALDSWLLSERTDHYTPEMRESGLYVPVGKYVCKMVDGKLERIPNPNGLIRCEKIIRTFLFAITGGKAGITGDKAIESAIALKTKFWVNVQNEVYEGKVQSKLDPDGFKPYVPTVAVIETADDMDADLKA